MHAITVTGPTTSGQAPTLALTEVPTPTPGPGDVLLQIHAAGVNRADLLQARGQYPPPPGASPTLGLEAAGIVTAVGDGVDPTLVGRPAMALLDGGGYAEYAVVPATQLIPLPADPDLTLAAALPEALCTAWFNLVGICGLTAGETALIHGGSGGVGHVAIQLAVRLGARVLTTAGSPAKAARCGDLGADVAIDYHDDVAAAVARATDGRGVDVILDVLGAGALAANLGMLAVGGRLAVIGVQQGRRAELDLGLLLAKRLTVHGSTLRARSRAEKAAIVAGAAPFAALIRPHVHSVVPLAQAAAAHALLDDPNTFGKIVLAVG